MFHVGGTQETNDMSGIVRRYDVAQMGLTPVFVLLIALAGGLFGPIRIAAAQASEPSYYGKLVRMVIANGAGGAYDIYARILAAHLSRHVPGNPSIIDQNMPLAGGMQATNWAYAAAPKDGTVILATFNSLLAEPLYGNPATRYDPRKFEYIGSISKQQNICATWHTNPVKTIAQAKAHEVIVPATGSSSDSAILPRILNAVLGTRFKVVLGYSTSDSRLAVERGEADGVCVLSWSTLKVANPEWIQKRLLNVLLQTGTKPQRDLPDVPLLVDLVSSPDDKKAIEVLSFQQDMGRPFLMPPDTPKEMVTTMRRAFEATVRDPLFLADANRAFLEVDPMTGETMEQVLKNAYSVPEALLQRAVELHGSEAN
jgi:tripartite-type tricarboxylate transporter receptor subunit TctC